MSGREKPLILQNGMPIPQEYDKDLGDWTEYSNEHIKAIKAELALVKAELRTIKANQLSGDQKVQLSGTITKVVSYTLPVTAGGTTTNLEITPPAGKKWTIQQWDMMLSPPSAATTGTHRLVIQLTESGMGSVSLFNLLADYKDRMQRDSGVFLKDGSGTPFSQNIRPSDPSVLANLLRGVEITSAAALRFRYENNTDALQESGLIKIAVIEEG